MRPKRTCLSSKAHAPSGNCPLTPLGATGLLPACRTHRCCFGSCRISGLGRRGYATVNARDGAHDDLVLELALSALGSFDQKPPGNSRAMGPSLT